LGVEYSRKLKSVEIHIGVVGAVIAAICGISTLYFDHYQEHEEVKFMVADLTYNGSEKEIELDMVFVNKGTGVTAVTGMTIYRKYDNSPSHILLNNSSPFLIEEDKLSLEKMSIELTASDFTALSNPSCVPHRFLLKVALVTSQGKDYTQNFHIGDFEAFNNFTSTNLILRYSSRWHDFFADKSVFYDYLGNDAQKSRSIESFELRSKSHRCIPEI
jgi:hypothetical protein